MSESGALLGWYWRREAETFCVCVCACVSQGPFVKTQIPRGLASERTYASAVEGRRLTA
jgi:hypothetical protein